MRADRRRFLTIAAAASGAALLPSSRVLAGDGIRRWQGTALGADASLQLVGLSERMADRLVERCLQEVTRLERALSLFRPDSALVQLNRKGRLDAPPADLVRVMQEAVTYGHLTDGVFDITTQPLWTLYAEHFATNGADAAGPPVSAVAAVQALIDFRAVEVEPSRITFARPGMAVTLNGIAQGYITDRIAELLLNEGLSDVLVDMGEVRALGRHPAGRPWRVSIRQVNNDGPSLDLTGALATSATNGTCFDPGGRFGHILDPRSGRPAPGPRQVSVRAGTASRADALSTAFLLMPPSAAAGLAGQLGGITLIPQAAV